MNPFPFPLSSPLSQLIAGGMFFSVSVYVAFCLVLFLRKGSLVAVPAKLVGGVGVLRLRRYKYEVDGKVYWRFALSGGQLFRGELVGKSSGDMNIPRKEKIVIKYDPLCPWVACVNCNLGVLQMFIALVFWALLFFLFFLC
ncbi:hypothetical protein [Alloalcanivorax gelatiniphagus]|uniref:DUF3592 domain-containing protein n=1 Tax=Alloalcanivorax gelatiniphagus TaxID=1194167 RepID=A0ABY2XPX1_9GAMM|nr:hypothetical protein [Alloalcanivorax gelatiniphagus]TMW14692.1 hypothetical protein FGS76_02580 [Alloalcanivorax gelatiniphagus]